MKITIGELKHLIKEEIDLTSLSHNRKTDLSSGQVSLVDFVVLYLGENGPTRRIELERAIDKFRGWVPKKFGTETRPQAHTTASHLFSREYGHISKGFEDLESDIGNPNYGFGTMQTTLWFGNAKGVYALNANGMARYAKIVGTK